MRQGVAVLAWLMATAGGHRAVGVQPPRQDIGSQVRAIFAVKCAGCHGPDLPKPKGRFGYVLDLSRVAGNPELVVPSRPEESELWSLVGRGEMPPTDSPHGPLTTAEKEVIRTWIAAGAPDTRSPTAEFPDQATEPGLIRNETSPVVGRSVRWPGKFHLLLVHFPIALMIAAGVGEVRSAMRRERVPSESVRFCLWVGALVAVPTVVLGWLHAAAGNGAGFPQLLTAHRWLGTSAGLWLVLTAACGEIDVRRGVRGPLVRFMLAVGIVLMAIAAHLGGVLDRGRDFFEW